MLGPRPHSGSLNEAGTVSLLDRVSLEMLRCGRQGAEVVTRYSEQREAG